MGTFWKVAVLPCTGVLAPICSCWHNATSFSISVITADFSSSTSWNREKRQTGSEMSFRTAEMVYDGTCRVERANMYTDRFTGQDLQCSWSNMHHKKEKRADKINENLVLLHVIHQQQPGHDLLLKSVIQLS